MSALARDADFERIELSGLDEAETEALVATYAEGRASDSFVLRLREETEGNPFFVRETLRSLADAAAAGEDLELALSHLTVPAGVKELVEARLARLSDTAQQVLTVAAVVGREFRLEVLEELLDEPVERIIAALEEASAAGLVDEVANDADRFVFPQALVRDTLYERQSGSRRVRLHHRIALALEELGLGATPAELAHHFYESHHLDREGKATEYAVQAGAEAAAALAYEEAAAHYATRAGGRPGRAAPLRAAAGARRLAGAGGRSCARPRRTPARRRSPAPSASRSCSGRRRSAAARAGRRRPRSTGRRSRCSRRRWPSWRTTARCR